MQLSVTFLNWMVRNVSLIMFFNSAPFGFLMSISWKLNLRTVPVIVYPDLVWIKIMDSYNSED
jgi:hypothetical protein